MNMCKCMVPLKGEKRKETAQSGSRKATCALLYDGGGSVLYKCVRYAVRSILGRNEESNRQHPSHTKPQQKWSSVRCIYKTGQLS